MLSQMRLDLSLLLEPSVLASIKVVLITVLAPLNMWVQVDNKRSVDLVFIIVQHLHLQPIPEFILIWGLFALAESYGEFQGSDDLDDQIRLGELFKHLPIIDRTIDKSLRFLIEKRLIHFNGWEFELLAEFKETYLHETGPDACHEVIEGGKQSALRVVFGTVEFKSLVHVHPKLLSLLFVLKVLIQVVVFKEFKVHSLLAVIYKHHSLRVSSILDHLVHWLSALRQNIISDRLPFSQIRDSFMVLLVLFRWLIVI